MLGPPVTRLLHTWSPQVKQGVERTWEQEWVGGRGLQAAGDPAGGSVWGLADHVHQVWREQPPGLRGGLSIHVSNAQSPWEGLGSQANSAPVARVGAEV